MKEPFKKSYTKNKQNCQECIKKFGEWLSNNRWINSENSIPPWKRDEITKALIEIAKKDDEGGSS